MERSLLERYRSDRRKLLDFILHTGLAADGRCPPGGASPSGIDLDVISADYVLELVKAGGVLDLSEGSRRYRDELKLPVLISSKSRSIFYLNSESALSGLPPQRIPPQVGADVKRCQTSYSSDKLAVTPGGENLKSKNTNEMICRDEMLYSHQPSKEITNLQFGLPALCTGLSNDDIREAAYEILLSAAFFSGGHMYPSEQKPKGKKSKFVMGLRSKREKVKIQTNSADWPYEILDVIRTQMEISEAMDACIKQGLMRFYARSTLQQMDVPHIAIELFSNIHKSDFINEKAHRQWQKRQVNILEEHLHSCAKHAQKDEYLSCRASISMLRHAIEGGSRMDLNQQTEILTSLKRFFSRLSDVPGKFGLPGESCYWTNCYHLNIRLYQKLLLSVFDILEDGQLVEELEEFLSFFRLTWSILGITERIHDVLYGSAILQQYFVTGETALLKCAVLQIQKALTTKGDSRSKQETYLNSLLCSSGSREPNENLNLMHAVLFSVRDWCDNQLKDYHLHFDQNPEKFEIVLTLATTLGLHFTGGDDENKVQSNMKVSLGEVTSELLKEFVESSIVCACRRILDLSDTGLKSEGKHHLALLADDFRLTAERELTIFSPKLCHLYPKAGIISSMLLHKIYGKQLIPFLESVSELSESAASVLASADILERCLAQLFFSSLGENSPSFFTSDLNPYKIGEISWPLLLQWENAQHANILKWTERAILIEEWVPLSSRQRCAASAVEVFRIIEENINQFFSFNLPMETIHLRSLLIGTFRVLDTYLSQLLNKLVDKKHLYPDVSPLSRYKEATNFHVKKKPTGNVFLEESIINQLNSLSISKLCVRLNTVHYIREQVDVLEESLKESWKHVHPVKNPFLNSSNEGLETSIDAVDQLFSVFDEIKKTSFHVSNVLCDFIGARVIFWDLRETFLFSVYHQNVENARLDIAIQEIDSVLNHICDLVIDSLRDQVILKVYQASIEGFVWILLDGGPSRAFSDADILMMQEDLNMLKEFFMASGDGLQHDIVEKEAKLVQKILDIYGLKTGTIIEMLMCASEHISVESDLREAEERLPTNSDSLLRILCHKKDREASKFLKKHYHLPKSVHEETTGKDFTLIKIKHSHW